MEKNNHLIYVNERHAYLELKVRKGWELQKCYCGDHRDEKAELARYRRCKAKGKLAQLSPVDRIKKSFEAMDQAGREAFLEELINGG